MKKFFSFKKNKKHTLAAQRQEHKRLETEILASFEDVFETIDLQEKLAKLEEINKALTSAQETDHAAAKKEKRRVALWRTSDMCLGTAVAVVAAVPTNGASLAFAAAAFCGAGVRSGKLGRYNNEAARYGDRLESYKESVAALTADIKDTQRREAEAGIVRYAPRHAL